MGVRILFIDGFRFSTFNFLNMETLDWIIIAVIAIGAILGFMKGFLNQLASIVGLIAGLLVARALFVSVGKRLAAEMGASVTFSQILAFVIIWMLVPIGLCIIAGMLTKALDVIRLGFVNRWLGAGLGVIKYGLLASIVIYFIEYVDTENTLIQPTKKQASVLYYPMKRFSGIFIPVVKDVTQHLINTDYARTQ